MSLLNFFKKIDPQKTFDTLSSGIDKVFYTKEEKADAGRQAWLMYTEWQKSTLDENTTRSLTRRFLAMLFACVYLALIIAAAVVYKFDPSYSEFLWNVGKSLAPYVGGIMVFYFGYYAVKNVVKESNKKTK